jgi:hypothetical protein
VPKIIFFPRAAPVATAEADGECRIKALVVAYIFPNDVPRFAGTGVIIHRRPDGHGLSACSTMTLPVYGRPDVCYVVYANKRGNFASNPRERIMKKLILTVLAAGSLLSARAQLFGPEAGQGALLGGILGGVIGANTGGHHVGRGIAIGAASGLVLGSLASDYNRSYYGGYGYGGGYYGGYGYYGRPYYSYYGYRPYYRYGYSYPYYSYYGSPAYYTAPVVTQPAAVQPPAQQQPVTIINNYYNTTPMSSANSMFGR